MQVSIVVAFEPPMANAFQIKRLFIGFRFEKRNLQITNYLLSSD
jgi:hypothetical protein